MAQLVKNPPAMRDTWIRSLGWEDPLEKGMDYTGVALVAQLVKNPPAMQETWV